MAVLAQDPFGDLALVDGRLVVVRDVATEQAQKIRDRFALVLGEWFLDTRLGVPYVDLVFVKSPDLELIRRMFRRVILSVQGIVDVPELDVEDLGRRQWRFTFRAVTDLGAVITGGSEEPFLVQPPAEEE